MFIAKIVSERLAAIHNTLSEVTALLLPLLEQAGDGDQALLIGQALKFLHSIAEDIEALIKILD